MAPLPPCSRKLLHETVKTFTVFPRGCIFSTVKTIVCCLCHLVRVTFTVAVGISRGFHVAVLRILVLFKGWLLSLFFCLVVLPTRCLLDVSRLFGLTLRPSAPVCCCHRDSLTRGRLAFAQEAVRGPPSLSPRLVVHMMTCAQ